MIKERPALNFLIIFFFLLITPHLAMSANAKVSDLSLSNDSKSLVLSFNIKDAFTRDIEEAILSGIPTTFTFFVEIYKIKRFRRDDKIIGLSFRHTVKYDNLKEEFVLNFDEDPAKKVILKDMASVKNAMTKINDLVTTSLLSFKENEIYNVKVKAKLKTIKLPFPLKYVLFFVSFWDFKTKWSSKTFSVKNGKVIVVK